MDKSVLDSSNVYNVVRVKDEIAATMKFLSETLVRTLGPYGATTLIMDRQLQHRLTKDGYTVLRNIFLKNELPRTILDIVKSISGNQVRTVGDGSTSAIIVASELYARLSKLISESNMSPKDIVDILNFIGSEFEWIIKNSAKPIDDEMIRLEDIARISSNNDIETGMMISEIFKKIGRHGFVNIENSLDEDYYEITSGVEVPRGLINWIFANKEDKRTCEFDQPLVFMTNGRLDTSDMDMMLDLVGEVCKRKATPLVVIAKEYSSDMRTFFHMNKMEDKQLRVCAIDIAIESEHAMQTFNDLAISLGCVPLDKLDSEFVRTFPLERLGGCEKSVINDLSSKFIQGFGDSKQIDERVSVIQEMYTRLDNLNDHIDRSEELYHLRKRMATLQKSMAVLYVGGNSEVEREAKKYLMEDAVFACRSALEHGYIVGGNLTVPRILTDILMFNTIKKSIRVKFSNLSIEEKFLDNLLTEIRKSFAISFQSVLTNARLADNEVKSIMDECTNKELFYNLKKRAYESDTETSVINSAETDIQIIKSSFSIIGQLVTCNQFISINI
jgi:chaperonin GroEL